MPGLPRTSYCIPSMACGHILSTTRATPVALAGSHIRAFQAPIPMPYNDGKARLARRRRGVAFSHSSILGLRKSRRLCSETSSGLKRADPLVVNSIPASSSTERSAVTTRGVASKYPCRNSCNWMVSRLTRARAASSFCVHPSRFRALRNAELVISGASITISA
jgi:hypothetical protein